VPSGVRCGRILKKTQLQPSPLFLDLNPITISPIPHIPHYQRQVTVVAQSNLSLSRTSRSLFASLSSFAPKAAGPALVFATRSALTQNEWNSRSSTVNSVQQTRYASNKDRKNKNMPPKKVVKEEPVQLGRPGNSLNAGIVCTN
jgi:hypothetical protein